MPHCNKFRFASSISPRSAEVSESEVVYLLHFSSPLHHAQHYLGTTSNLERRLHEHFNQDGSPLVAALVNSGRTFQVARVWQGGRNLERTLKRRKNGRSLCPICSQQRGGR